MALRAHRLVAGVSTALRDRRERRLWFKHGRHDELRQPAMSESLRNAPVTLERSGQMPSRDMQPSSEPSVVGAMFGEVRVDQL